MLATLWVPAFGVLSVLLCWQLARVLGRVRGTLLGLLVAAGLGGGWWLLGWLGPIEAGPSDWSSVPSVSSDSCVKCHPDHHASWHRTFHRTMTREATPEYVKGDFADAVLDYHGVRSRMFRTGDHFVMETIDPTSALLRARGDPAGPRLGRFRVDRLVGSHWVQECLHLAPNGKYVRLPILYHLVEKRWIHSHGAFLAPESPDFWEKSRGFAWNDTCLYCHNTTPSKNPVLGARGEVVGYRSEVAELGISCEACHGPAGDHVRVNQNPARRLALQQTKQPDPTIVHPGRLPVPRRDDICARCHGALSPRAETWDRETMRDPFIAGQDLSRFNRFVWSEAELFLLKPGRPIHAPIPPKPDDGRFWGDGTPLTTALESNGMALSGCYQEGRGQLSCLSCHQMHGDDPNFMLRPGMQTNEACYQCHSGYRERLTEHTKHPATSPGSLCYSCHMPHQVYSLLTTHRSHRIQTPKLADSVGTGKPHACNLCHLDRSLGWTREQLARWPGQRNRGSKRLSTEEETIASGLLVLTRGDARSRAIVAGVLSRSEVHRAAGTDWYGTLVPRLLEHERYPVIRYLLHRGWRAARGEGEAGPYDYLGTPARRSAQLNPLRLRATRPVSPSRPGLPSTRDGLLDEALLRRLLDQRHDPDLTVNE